MTIGATTASAQGILKGDRGATVNHTFMLIFSTTLQKKAGINLQVNEGQTYAISSKLGQGKIDLLLYRLLWCLGCIRVQDFIRKN